MSDNNKCLEKLDLVDAYIRQKNNYSYDLLDELKKSKEIDRLYEANGIDELFKEELIKFLKLLFNDLYNYFPFIKKIEAHESSFIYIFRKYGYELSLYISGKELYRNLPEFIKSAINKYNLIEYKFIAPEKIEKVINEYVDLSYDYNDKYERILTRVEQKLVQNFTDYSKYEEKMKDDKLNTDDQTEFFIYSEYKTFIEEYNYLANNFGCNADYLVRWVSKNYGDGYGFDILSYDPKKRRQKVIEVKSGKSGIYTLTRVEYRALNMIRKMENVDYYVYEYYKDVNGSIKLSKLKFDKINNFFVDIETNEVHYISPYMYFDENKCEQIKVGIEKQKVYGTL